MLINSIINPTRHLVSDLKKKMYFFYFWFIQWRYKHIVKRVAKKDRIKVAFFLIHEPVWKYEGLYELLRKSNLFDPVVVVCPFMVYGHENMIRDMDQAFEAFSDRGYNVIKTFNKKTGEWLNIKKIIRPDIVFFTIPHPVTKKEYYINNFLDTLSCYVPYTFQTTFHFQQNYNRFFHNVLWKAYYQTEFHRQIAINFALNKGKNVVVTGYPGIDNFLFKRSDTDKNRINSRKKIIWAPHHTIEGEGIDLNFSNFLRYHDFMVQMAIEYKEKLFITFKPHPSLRAKLRKESIWGLKKTEDYYNFWRFNHFCDLNEGNYQLLFEESDAMIHDCDSFMIEYLSTGKPVLYTSHDNSYRDRLNDLGRSANDMHYIAKNKDDILGFLNEVVLKGNDIMREKRIEWIVQNIIPPENRSASKNIFIDLLRSLNIEQNENYINDK